MFNSMRYLLVTFTGVLLIAVCGCARSRYTHAVFITCAPGTSEAEMAILAAESQAQLGRIPGVRRITVGLRDRDVARGPSVTDFDVGMLIQFDDRQGYEEYLRHPIHAAHVEKHRCTVARMRVFDVVSH